MDIIAYKLNHQPFIDDYKTLCHAPFGDFLLISITFTLNPINNKLDILSQYRLMIQEIKYSSMFNHRYNNKKETWTINYGFETILMCPELTSNLNMHLHAVMKIHKSQVDIIYNEFKRVCHNSKVLGRQFTFKPVNDTQKDRSRVADYPFKDTDNLLRFPDSKKIYYYKLSRKNI